LRFIEASLLGAKEEKEEEDVDFVGKTQV
jgi:hypothetical protein